jgi:hypothetical protein
MIITLQSITTIMVMHVCENVHFLSKNHQSIFFQTIKKILLVDFHRYSIKLFRELLPGPISVTVYRYPDSCRVSKLRKNFSKSF